MECLHQDWNLSDSMLDTNHCFPISPRNTCSVCVGASWHAWPSSKSLFRSPIWNMSRVRSWARFLSKSNCVCIDVIHTKYIQDHPSSYKMYMDNPFIKVSIHMLISGDLANLWHGYCSGSWIDMLIPIFSWWCPTRFPLVTYRRSTCLRTILRSSARRWDPNPACPDWSPTRPNPCRFCGRLQVEEDKVAKAAAPLGMAMGVRPTLQSPIIQHTVCPCSYICWKNTYMTANDWTSTQTQKSNFLI